MAVPLLKNREINNIQQPNAQPSTKSISKQWLKTTEKVNRFTAFVFNVLLLAPLIAGFFATGYFLISLSTRIASIAAIIAAISIERIRFNLQPTKSLILDFEIRFW